MDSIKCIAYYLPQFHRLKFNDDYWGKGFTEWTNTAKAKPLFKGHYQPHVPADLGFYDLTVASVREEQASLAKQYGIDGFCYWHYWFGKDDKVMERPFEEVVKSKSPNFPFCLAWANHDWHNLKTKEVIIKQRYEGVEDYKCHFMYLKDAFLDERYMKIDGKRPIFVVFEPFGIPDTNIFFDTWNSLAKENGLGNFCFVAIVGSDSNIKKALDLGYDAVNVTRLREFEFHFSLVDKIVLWIKRRIFNMPYVFKYKNASKFFTSPKDVEEKVIPSIITGWDHTPRSGKRALVLDGYTPQTFGMHVDEVFSKTIGKNNKLVFVRAWNEWAEGNHLEPDLKWGLSFLETLKRIKDKYAQN